MKVLIAVAPFENNGYLLRKWFWVFDGEISFVNQ
jgi:hypothetical protein